MVLASSEVMKMVYYSDYEKDEEKLKEYFKVKYNIIVEDFEEEERVIIECGDVNEEMNEVEYVYSVIV